MSIPRLGWSFVSVLLGIVLLAAAPWLFHNFVRHLLTLSLLYAILASNWDLTLGYAGVFNWAHTTFFALGAYTAGVLSKVFGISPWLSLGVAVAIAVLAAIVVCVPVLRVKGIYIVLVTFAFGQLCLHVIVSMSDYTGGTQGLVLIPPLKLGSYSFAQDGKLAYYYLALGLFLASTAYLRWLVSSNFGLSIVALRDHEDYAISRGISRSRQRMLTFIASAVFTGAAGGLYTFYLRVVSPEVFGFGLVVTLLSMLFLGGIRTIYGPIIAAFILTFVSESLGDLGPWRFVIMSLVILLVILLYPDGLLAALRRLTRFIDERLVHLKSERRLAP